MDGLSEATMEKLIDRGFVKTFADLFRLSKHEAEIVSMEGFGQKSFENMQKTIDGARHTTLSRLLFGLGIPGIGVAGGKLLSSHFNGDLDALRNAEEEELTEIDGIGAVMAHDIVSFFRDEEKAAALDDLLSEITLEQENAQEGASLSGKTFVVTGAVHIFANRDALKDFIDARGGKVASAVIENGLPDQ